MDPELKAALAGINARLDGIDKRLDGIDKRLDSVEKLARTALEETRQLARVVSGLLDDNKVYANGLATLLGMVSDNVKATAELKEQVGRLVQTTIESRSADAERWRTFEQRLAKVEHAVTELRQHSP
jgi:signal transduction histidine kinase